MSASIYTMSRGIRASIVFTVAWASSRIVRAKGTEVKRGLSVRWRRIPFRRAVLFAIILDALDLLLVGLIPILGEFIDILGAALILLSVNPRALVFVFPDLVSVATGTIPVLFPIELFPSFTVAILVGKYFLNDSKVPATSLRVLSYGYPTRNPLVQVV